jgi:hypothetical protein
MRIVVPRLFGLQGYYAASLGILPCEVVEFSEPEKACLMFEVCQSLRHRRTSHGPPEAALRNLLHLCIGNFVRFVDDDPMKVCTLNKVLRKE